MKKSEKGKYDRFQLLFNLTNKNILDWVRGKANEEDRSISNFIINRLKQAKEREEKNG
jgi:succinate dehydrogenase flavin-adding protein (antitoxin of CptAB toxin-antitoxin module)